MVWQCCLSGPHKCETCEETFLCDGWVGGITGRIYTDYPDDQITCEECLPWVTRPSYCRTCFKAFPSSSALHRHLRRHTDHMQDPWAVCPVCKSTDDCWHTKMMDRHVYYCFKQEWRSNFQLKQLFRSTGNFITKSFHHEELIRMANQRKAERKRLAERKERLSHRKVRYFNRRRATRSTQA